MLKLVIIFAVMAMCHGEPEEHNRYWLYTRSTGNRGVIVDLSGNPPVMPPEYNANHPIIILVHGLGGNRNAEFNTKITENLIRNGLYNVIVVDWEEPASLSESLARVRAVTVGAAFGNFLKLLIRATDPVKLDTLHLVGFGLGAHVAGIAARRYQNEEQGRVARITGLDPSGRGWGSDSQRLRDTDAVYVEVIHTDGSGPLANGIGTPIGDINFYANGGSNQPGCLSHDCSHNRAWDLFAASIENTNLVGKPCSTVSQLNLNLCRGTSLHMGGTTARKTGVSKRYRVNTKRSYPY